MTNEAQSVRKVIRWPSTAMNPAHWWIVDDRGTAERPQYEPVSGPYPHERAALAAMADLDRRA